MAATIEAHEGDGTLVKKEESALIVSEDGSLRMVMADYDEEVGVPQAALLLASVLVRADDETWVDEMVELLVEQYGDEEDERTRH
tara:strand:+ start:321 stop:575 length:255 start_codon:yes stop_codon:yes gene_type:complete